MKHLFTILALAAALAGCHKASNPVDEAAKDIKAMGDTRDKTKDALRDLNAAQEKAKETADKAGEAEPAKN